MLATMLAPVGKPRSRAAEPPEPPVESSPEPPPELPQPTTSPDENSAPNASEQAAPRQPVLHMRGLYLELGRLHTPDATAVAFHRTGFNGCRRRWVDARAVRASGSSSLRT